MPVQIEYSRPPTRLPAVILVLAWLYIGFGAIATFLFGWGIAHHGAGIVIYLVLGILIGRGILLRLEAARLCVVGASWIGMIGAASSELNAATFSKPLSWPAQSSAGLRLALAIFLYAAIFLFSLWQLRIINREDIKSLFHDDPEPGSSGRAQKRHWIWSLWIWILVALLIGCAGYLWGTQTKGSSWIIPFV